MVEWRQNFETHLIEGAKTIELTFSEKEMDQLSRYGELLIEWNEKMNLTGITDPQGVAIKHMLDSAVGISLIPQGASLVDVGTGAGFPGIVLKILRPDLEVVLLDSLRKRLNFLDAVIQELGLEKVQTVHARAEEAGHKKELRESFDIVVARAVSSLPSLLELCFPLVKKNGKFIAWKGPKGREEASDAKRALELLGGGKVEIIEIALPGADEPRLLIQVKKIKLTDKKYPRKPGSLPL